MTKHVIPADSLSNETVVHLRGDGEPGHRYRLERSKGDIVLLVSEFVDAKRVDDPKVRRRDRQATLWLDRPTAEWLRDALDDLLADEEWT